MRALPSAVFGPVEAPPCNPHRRFLFKAGLPVESLQLLLGDGEIIGPQVLSDERIKGVVFTGSCETSKKIQKNLSERKGEIVPLTAETGGLNFMVIDSSALPNR